MSAPKFHQFLLIAICFIFVTSCKKNLKEENPVDNSGNEFLIPASTPVTGSLMGMVVDENNHPVQGAAVKCATSTTTTDNRGIFRFQNIALDKYISTVTVTSPGYFKGVRSFSATTATNNVYIKLVPKTLAGSFNSDQAGTISLTNGTTITFSANSIINKATGIAYSGTVNVYAAYIDPTASDIVTTVPGSFMGRDDQRMYFLRSAGMVAVELESTSGDALQLASNKPANLKAPIPASLLNKAPSTIDTWSLDEKGVWVKEGQAVRNGNFYESQPTHFTFWNYDGPYNAIWLSVHVQDQNGNPVANATVTLTMPGNTTQWATVSSQTDNMGNCAGFVGNNIPLVMDVYSDPFSCSTPLFTQNIGPYASGSPVENVIVNFAASQILTVTGTVTDCNNQPLQNGTAIVHTGLFGYGDVPVVNGNYVYTTAHCSPVSSVDVIVLDNNTSAGNNSGNIPVTGNTVNVPALTACSIQPAVFTFELNQGNCNGFFSGEYSVNAALNNTNTLGFSVDVTVPGSYSISTNTLNGINFSGTGTFTTTGYHYIYLSGTGTPVSAGTYNFIVQALNTATNTCIQPLTVLPQQANFSFGGPGNCSGAVIAGNYIVGFSLNNTHTATITVDVTTVGDYKIYTDYQNGISFRDSGVFVNTGVHTVVLHATGVPNIAGTNYFTPSSVHGVSNCWFPVTSVNTTLVANYILEGSPGVCTNNVVYGNYYVDTTLDYRHSVEMLVTCTSPGNYSIATNTANGISFSATGLFTATGLYHIILSGHGTPVNAGTYTYTSQAQGITTGGCSFNVNTN